MIERQARQGVDYMTLHCGVTRESVKRLRAHQRIEGIVSRGGALLAAWIERTGNENPLYEHFDEVCAILREHDVTISLGDGLRPGATGDATDRGQIAELLVMGELTERARAMGVQVMIEGPGHVPLDQIEANVKLEKRVCGGAPFYVLGPLTCDVAPGYDHITGAIGGAIASAAGTDFLCYVTPAEHLRLPDIDDVREGVIATRIAAHSGDLVKGVRAAKVWNDQMSRYRKALNWEGMYAMAMDPDKARRYKEESEAAGSNVCTMCGSLCSVNIDNAAIKFTKRRALAEAETHAAALKECARSTILRAAREIALPDLHGKLRRLEEFRGQQLVVYFYPKDDTPGCTVEGKEFRDSFDQLRALECVIVGVSTDSRRIAIARSLKSTRFPFILLADRRRRAGRAPSACSMAESRRARPSCSTRTCACARAFHEVTPRGHAAAGARLSCARMLESHRMLGG